MHASARNNYNRLSRWYDLFAGSEVRFTKSGVQALAIQSGEHILEIGCGTGAALLDLAQAVDRSGLVVGLDLSRGMLEKSQEKIIQGSYTQTTILVEGDALSPPFKWAAFDVVFLSFTLELFSRPKMELLLEICDRLLKPTGRIGVVALQKEDRLAVKIYDWFHHRLPELIDCRPIDAASLLQQTGYMIRTNQRMLMWGLPVMVVTAQKG
jgi:ubiquinone/menaquinone biosynthesis C-methylase UbiE